MATGALPRPPAGQILKQELSFAVVFGPVSLAPVALMALSLRLDPGQAGDRQAMLIGALSSLIVVLLVYRLYQRRLLESSLREALAEQAQTDVLTGLGNRRRLYLDLDREVLRARRASGPISLLLVDLDGFKPINDRHGHAVGDALLVAFAEATRKATRAGVDATYRIGGDEFAVLLPGADTDEAALIARRLRVAFREAGAAMAAPLPVDCSLGVATRLPAHDEEHVDAWLRRADGVMYVAKRRGGGVALAPQARAPANEDASFIEDLPVPPVAAVRRRA